MTRSKEQRSLYAGYCKVLWHPHKLEMIEGDLPRRAQRMIEEWATQYKADLMTMWNSQAYKKLPGLE